MDTSDYIWTVDKGTPDPERPRSLKETNERYVIKAIQQGEAYLRAKRSQKFTFGFLGLAAICMVLNTIEKWSKPY